MLSYTTHLREKNISTFVQQFCNKLRQKNFAYSVRHQNTQIYETQLPEMKQNDKLQAGVVRSYKEHNFQIGYTQMIQPQRYPCMQVV